MTHLFCNLPSIKTKLTRAKQVIFMCDYDGTLTPIVKRPQDAALSSSMRILLKKCIIKQGIKFAIVSGRKLSDIESLIKLKGMCYVGNHGLEIRTPKKLWRHPEAVSALPSLKQIARRIRKELLDVPGLQIEDKELTLSIHWRRVKTALLPRVRRIFSGIVEHYKNTGKVRITTGKKVWEIRPPCEWNKGNAVDWLVKYFGGGLPVYIGDNTTDEDAFRAVNHKKGISIRVGQKRNSISNYYVKNVTEVRKILEFICVAELH